MAVTWRLSRKARTRKKARKPLGQRLLDGGLVTQPQLDLALREQKRLGGFLGDALQSLGFVTHEVITSFLAEDTHSEVVDVVNLAIDPEGLQHWRSRDWCYCMV